MKSLVTGSASLPQDVEPINENDLENLSVSDEADKDADNQESKPDHLNLPQDESQYKTPQRQTGMKAQFRQAQIGSECKFDNKMIFFKSRPIQHNCPSIKN